MTDDPDIPEEPEEETAADSDGVEPQSNSGVSRRPSWFSQLDAFAKMQRQVAAFDFGAITATQRAITQAPGLRIAEIFAAQDAVRKQFAKSIDFAQLTSAQRALKNAGAVSTAIAAQQQWVASLAKAVDMTALQKAFASSADVARFTATQEALAEQVRRQSEIFKHLTEGINYTLQNWDFSRFAEALDRLFPFNLRDVPDLDVVATIAIDDGIPFAWIPRREIVNDLVAADTPEERHAILEKHRDDVLDDCDSALEPYDNEWATQCRVAIAAMRAGGLDPAAQSHASNIIDSVVLAPDGIGGRNEAKKRAEADFDDLPLLIAAENLTLRPLMRAYTQWYPDSGETPPGHFARHATSHAVGHAGVFAPMSALVAVMLATSLTVQYSPLEDPPREEDTSGNPDRNPQDQR